MQIGIWCTGNVAQTLMRSWSSAGHHITFGSRDPQARNGLDVPGHLAGSRRSWRDFVRARTRALLPVVCRFVGVAALAQVQHPSGHLAAGPLHDRRARYRAHTAAA